VGSSAGPSGRQSVRLTLHPTTTDETVPARYLSGADRRRAGAAMFGIGLSHGRLLLYLPPGTPEFRRNAGFGPDVLRFLR
jgi:hypothetical protein